MENLIPDLTPDEWCEQYPARKVSEIPEYICDDITFDNQWDAERHLESIEMEYQCGGREVVEFNGLFYITYD
jgi:hypothetical protein